MRQLVGQSERLVASLLGLVWIAKKPEGEGRKRAAGHLRVLPVEEGSNVLRIVEGNPCFQVRSGLGKFAKQEQGLSQCIVGLYKEDGSMGVLGQAAEVALPAHGRS